MKFYFYLYLLSILIISCRPKNQIPLDYYPQSDQKLFLSLEHGKGKSLLRQKLLNMKLREMLKDTSRFEPNEMIENGDEFFIDGVTKKLTAVQLVQYKKLRSHCAGIIVSYLERQEIYFVTPGVDTTVILKSLNLIKENNNHFTIFQHGDRTVKGEMIYVLNAGTEELKINDRLFHWSEWKLEDPLDGEKFMIHSNQKLTFKIQAKHLRDQIVTSIMTAPKSKCTPEKMEAEACQPCQYQMEIPSGNKIEYPIKNLSDVHLDFFINGKSYLEKDLVVDKSIKGEWSIEIDPIKLKAVEDVVLVEIKHTNELNAIKHVRGFNYTASCLDARVERDIRFKEEFPVVLQASLYGRELLIDSIKE